MLSRFSKPFFMVTFITVWSGMLFFAPLSIHDMADYVLFSFLGLLGAIFANTTGAGGGVVFIPMFNQLNFTESQSIATSFTYS